MSDKIMKTFNGYEIYDEFARNEIAGIKTQINEGSLDVNVQAITNDEIDAICGTNIVSVEGVEF